MSLFASGLVSLNGALRGIRDLCGCDDVGRILAQILDLRNSEADGSQRMLNAIEPGSPLPVHRHKKTNETMVCLRGRSVMENYSDAGECVETIDLWVGGAVVVLNVPAGEWDTVRVLESETVMLEMKDGGEAIGSEDVLEL